MYLALGDNIPAAGDGLDRPLLHRRRPFEAVSVHSSQELVLQPHRVEVLHHLQQQIAARLWVRLAVLRGIPDLDTILVELSKIIGGVSQPW